MCIPRATVSAVSCLVVPAFICIDLLISRVLKINADDDDDDDDRLRNDRALGNRNSDDNNNNTKKKNNRNKLVSLEDPSPGLKIRLTSIGLICM